MNDEVFAVACNTYESEEVDKALNELLIQNNLLSFIKPGIKVAIKANLVAASKPDQAIITHPALLCSLSKILTELGASVIIGDSPGGLFNEAMLKPIYNKGGISEAEKYGAKLNHNYEATIVETNGLRVVKNLDCSNWLLDADVIINFAKMKSHGMMSLSAATKNMFGSVPGPIKLEYHYRYHSHNDFAKMLLDIQDFYKPVLHIVDSILAMEGNGPTAGTPKHMGILLAGNNCHAIDLVCCKLMNLDPLGVPTLALALNEKLVSANDEDIKVNMDIAPFISKDYNNITHMNNIEFYSDNKGGFKLLGKLAKKIMIVRPKADKKQCINCRKCHDICPAKAITMKNKVPCIDKSKCIRCFCCQEFCPVGAMKTHRTLLAKILTKKK